MPGWPGSRAAWPGGRLVDQVNHLTTRSNIYIKSVSSSLENYFVIFCVEGGYLEECKATGEGLHI